MQISTFILVFIISAALAFGLTNGLIRVCHKLSLYDHPGRHKRHKKPTPNLGGVGIFISIWAAAGLVYLFNPALMADIRPFLFYIIAGSCIIFLVGLVDDLWPLPAWPKLFAEVITGLILYFGGLSINTLSIPGYGTVDLAGFGMAITILWVVGLTNAVNLIDGLDGLASGVSGIAAATMVVIGLNYHIESVALISLILCASLSSFWIYNRYPARIFLGDSGSLLIGYFFAIISLVVPIKSFTLAALFIPLVVLGVPLVETVSSFVRRLAAGKNVMRADRRHLFHYLRYAGLSRGVIVNLFYLLGAVFSLISIMMLFFNRSVLLAILILFMVVIFIIYFILISKIRRGWESLRR